MGKQAMEKFQRAPWFNDAIPFRDVDFNEQRISLMNAKGCYSFWEISNYLGIYVVFCKYVRHIY